MTPAVINAATRVITRGLLQKFEENLLIAPLCVCDYAPGEKHRRGDNVNINPALGGGTDLPVLRLKQLTTEIFIPDVSELFVNEQAAAQQIQLAADKLASSLETELVDCFSEFTRLMGSANDGITPELLYAMDQIMFDSQVPPGPLNLIINDLAWEQLTRQYGSQSWNFEISTPAPEFQSGMLSGAVFHRNAIALVTRPLSGESAPGTSYPETGNIGFTAVPVPGAGKDLILRVHLLYDIKIINDRFGIRIPMEIGIVPKTASIPYVKSAVNSTVSGEFNLTDLQLKLEHSITEPLLTRLEISMESLEDIVPDEGTRFAAALRLMEKTDSIKLDALQTACVHQEQLIASAEREFELAVSHQYAAEIQTRQSRLTVIESEIEAARVCLQQSIDLYAQVKEEITRQQNLLTKLQTEFTERVTYYRTENARLTSKLSVGPLPVVHGSARSRKRRASAPISIIND